LVIKPIEGEILFENMLCLAFKGIKNKPSKNNHCNRAESYTKEVQAIVPGKGVCSVFKNDENCYPSENKPDSISAAFRCSGGSSLKI
jgi:hypothetical protein